MIWTKGIRADPEAMFLKVFVRARELMKMKL